ncbi:MAG: hypothetical protein V4702_02975 [Patescibacteria group bacterium]
MKPRYIGVTPGGIPHVNVEPSHKGGIFVVNIRDESFAGSLIRLSGLSLPDAYALQNGDSSILDVYCPADPDRPGVRVLAKCTGSLALNSHASLSLIDGFREFTPMEQ